MTHWQLALLVISGFLVFFALFGAIHHVFFVLVYFFRCKKRRYSPQPTHSFKILIPAHNESLGLKGVLECCLALDYPRELFSVVVVADNCTDDTAQIARDCGVTCLERFDTTRRGKGEALEWAIPQALADHNSDAVMILDADCFLAPQALRACDFELAKGNQVLQMSYLVSNADESFRCYAMGLARFIENQLYYWPKSKAGLSIAMLGTGMVFHRDVFVKCPWQAGGLTEDYEYGLDLMQNNFRPVFVGEIGLVSPFPVEMKQLETQRSRWASGVLQGVRKTFGPLLCRGICRGNIVTVDAAVSMLYVSRPLILLQVFLAGIMAVITRILVPNVWGQTIFWAWSATLALYFAYAMTGVLVMGLTWRRLKFLMLSPAFVLKYMALTAKSLLNRRPKEWERTPRKPEE
jgi:Glycosyltransferases, probably involved in cell wall biogenesis